MRPVHACRARRATVARDGQVRISDVGDAMHQSVAGREVVYTPRQTNVRVLRCHNDAVKRIVTEDSPDLFLTVSEVRCAGHREVLLVLNMC